jgi:hypothetical protein
MHRRSAFCVLLCYSHHRVRDSFLLLLVLFECEAGNVRATGLVLKIRQANIGLSIPYKSSIIVSSQVESRIFAQESERLKKSHARMFSCCCCFFQFEIKGKQMNREAIISADAPCLFLFCLIELQVETPSSIFITSQTGVYNNRES